jgi:dCMP deaminase
VLNLASFGSAEMPWGWADDFRYSEEECDAAFRSVSAEWEQMRGYDDHERPTWDKTYMDFAEIVGQRSRCSRDQVGCVIVTDDNRVASACYNGPPPRATETGAIPRDGRCINWCPRAMYAVAGEPVHDGYADCYSNHAESNAIARANWTDIAGGTAYVTSTPCIACAKNLVAAQLGRVVFRVDPLRPRDVGTVLEFFKSLGGLDVTTL